MTLMSFDKWDDISSSIETCIERIIIWMQHVKKTENLCIKVRDSYINSSMCIRNLGVILDNTLGMEYQVNSVCKSCYYQIINKGLIHKYIND